MKKIRAFLYFLSLALLLLLTSCIGTSKNVYISPAFIFSVEFPAKFKPVYNTVETEFGPMEMYGAQAELPDKAFTLAYCDYSKEIISKLTTKELLDASVLGSFAADSAEIIDVNEITFNNYPGREIVAKINIEDLKGVFFQRAFLVKNRMYVLNLTSDEKFYIKDEELLFFESFKLL